MFFSGLQLVAPKVTDETDRSERIEMQKSSENTGQPARLPKVVRNLVDYLRENELPFSVRREDGCIVLESPGKGSGGTSVMYLRNVSASDLVGDDYIVAKKDQLRVDNGDPLGLVSKLNMRSRLILWAAAQSACRVFIGNGRAVCRYKNGVLVVEDVPPTEEERREIAALWRRYEAWDRLMALSASTVFGH